MAAEAGADYIGVILSPGYARSRTLSEAGAIFGAAGGVRRVGVVVDAPLDFVLHAADSLELDVVQFHGAETPGQVSCRFAAAAAWKALRIEDSGALQQLITTYRAAHGLLLEPRVEGAAGGTGARLDWASLAGMRDFLRAHTFVLAGGLNPANVAQAITLLAPDVVDVSSGVEAEVGRKAPGKVHDFVQIARSAVIEQEAGRNGN